MSPTVVRLRAGHVRGENSSASRYIVKECTAQNPDESDAVLDLSEPGHSSVREQQAFPDCGTVAI